MLLFFERITMAYIVEMGAIDYVGNLVSDDSAKDYYNNPDDAWDAYDKLTEDYVHDFLMKDLGFDEDDIGFYKRLLRVNKVIDECKWELAEE